MKVIIGPYTSWIGPYQIAEALCFWAKDTKDEFGVRTKPEWVHRFGTWLAERKDGSDSWLTKLCEWIHSKNKRQVYVRIDKFDTWSMDHTLALIILPMLKQLKATKHGSPHVDDFDCPQHLWSTNARTKEHEWDTDEFHHQRWDYVLQEMIWAFEQLNLQDDTAKFYDHSAVNNSAEFKEQLANIKVDQDALNHHEHRKQQALKLFGKYYTALWD